MSPKYRHRGYQDSDDDRERPRLAPRQDNLTKEERIQKRSLRHALDRDARDVLRCHKCGRSVEDFGAVATDTRCPHCAASLHCCRTCSHFDSAARHQCRAEISAPVAIKIEANQCPQYAPRLVLDSTGRRTNPHRGANDPKTQFENLFKR